MTDIPLDLTFGPISRGRLGAITIVGYTLDDADDAAGYIFQIPKTGVITDVGILVTLITGSASAYNMGLMVVDPTTSNPSTVSGYGGSVPTQIQPTVSGWYWATLQTPASGMSGDWACVLVYPTLSGTYNGTNSITISNLTSFTTFGPVRRALYATSWSFSVGMGMFAIRYNDGSVWGMPFKNYHSISFSGESSPNEIGIKFTAPMDMVSPGAGLDYQVSTTDPSTKYTITLYDEGNNILRQIYIDNYSKMFPTLNQSAAEFYWDSPVTLTTGNVYRLALKANSGVRPLIIYDLVYESADSRNNSLFYGLSNFQRTERKDNDAWTDLNEEVFWGGIRLSSISVTTSGSSPTPSGGGGAYAYVG